MKKFVKLSLVAAALATVLGFASCKNNDDDDNAVIPVSTTVAAVTTTGSVVAATTVNGSTTATLAASNGSYTFTESTGANASIASRTVAVDSIKGGTWTFTEKGASSPKYSGSYKGDISKLASEEVKLTLTVQKVLSNGSLKEVSTATDFSFDATTSTFSATIPAVTVKTTTSLSGAEATTTITEVAFTDAILNNKIFKSEEEYYIFANNKCYVDDSIDNAKVYADNRGASLVGTVVIKLDNKLYTSRENPRTSGSGLFATFTARDHSHSKNYEKGKEYWVFSADGTGVYTSTIVGDAMKIPFTFINNSGVITANMTYEGQSATMQMLYDGNSIYLVDDELHFVGNYAPAN